MTLLLEGSSLKYLQETFTTVYYRWYNSFEDKDFKIRLNVKNGFADVFVGTYDENIDSQNLLERMPSSKRNALWTLDEIGSTSFYQETRNCLLLTMIRTIASIVSI